jgi:hypothetical protein
MASARDVGESSQGPQRAVAEATARPLSIQPGIKSHYRLLVQICQLFECCSYTATPFTRNTAHGMMPYFQNRWWSHLSNHTTVSHYTVMPLPFKYCPVYVLIRETKHIAHSNKKKSTANYTSIAQPSERAPREEIILFGKNRKEGTKKNFLSLRRQEIIGPLAALEILGQSHYTVKSVWIPPTPALPFPPAPPHPNVNFPFILRPSRHSFKAILGVPFSISQRNRPIIGSVTG